MAAPIYTNPEDDSRFTRLETQMGGLAQQFSDFLRENKDHRDRIEIEQSKIWTAMQEQGKNMQASVDRLTARGQISWPVIMVTITVVLTIFSLAAGLGHALMESRIRQLEIQDTANKELMEAKNETQNVRIDEALRLGLEDKEAIRLHILNTGH